MMNSNKGNTRTERFFWYVTALPKTLISFGVLLVLVTGFFLPQITKDTTADSFIPVDHPALIYREKVQKTFGLKDPMVIAVIHDGQNGIFNPHSLSLVKWLTEKVAEIPGIDTARIMSLATEDNIIGTEDAMIVEPFFDNPPTTQKEADQVREQVMDFPLYLGSLVSRDGKATLIIAELIDEKKTTEIYNALLVLVNEASVEGEELHVAGEGAVSGYLATYIDQDFQRLVPLSAVLISIILFFAYRTLTGVVLPNFVVLATAVTALGTMAALDVPFFVITNSMPVLLIGIAVADSVHILGQYYEEFSTSPNTSQRQLVIRTMVKMWRPVTMTTLTTMGGFLGVLLASYMPPMQYFGIFSMLGIAVAGLFSLFIVPAGLVLVKPKGSKAFLNNDGSNTQVEIDKYGQVIGAIGLWVVNSPIRVIILSLVIMMGGIAGGLNLEVNDAWVNNFRSSEPIYQADQKINALMDGTSYLDIIIDSGKQEGLFIPQNLQLIEGLQTYLETLPHVNGSTSIVDYIKQMNRSMNGGNSQSYHLPDDPALIAQYFLLYSLSGDPTDFEEEVDYDYQIALVRARLDTGLYTDEKIVVEAVQQYIEEHFNSPNVSANLSGRVYVDYEWFERLFGTHFKSALLSLVLVWLLATISFKSIYGGCLAMVPVGLAVLFLYAFMGVTGITLAVGTTMTVAIGLGIGVDFSIHTLDRLTFLIREKKNTPEKAFKLMFATTGRALLFNFAAVFIGFGVLGFSQVPPLARFGALIALSVLISFIASMTLLPALVKVLRPKFIGFTTVKTSN